jgi:glycosyltransferase involved in cell wall biosynthesis
MPSPFTDDLIETPLDAATVRPQRVLHLVSARTEANAVVNGMLVPMLMKGDRRTLAHRVVNLSSGHPLANVLRQSGVPVHEVNLSRKRWSMLAPRELLQVVRDFEPDVIHAWGLAASIIAQLLRRFAPPGVRMVCSTLQTDVLPAGATSLDRMKLKFAVKLAPRFDQVVYPSEASRSRHRRAGFPEENSTVVSPGVDADRFKPSLMARKRVREKLGLAANAFVVCMHAPFQPEFDFITFLKAAGDVIRANPHAQVLLAGKGVQKGNAPLMALVGGGALATRVRLLGEWSDLPSLFSACDVVVSSALVDDQRLTLTMAMLCGIPCVATGVAAQGEVVGRFGITAEPGNEGSLARGILRVMELPQDHRLFMARTARDHAVTNFSLARSIWGYQMAYLGALDAPSPVEEPATEPAAPAVDASEEVDQSSAA